MKAYVFKSNINEINIPKGYITPRFLSPKEAVMGEVMTPTNSRSLPWRFISSKMAGLLQWS